MGIAYISLIVYHFNLEQPLEYRNNLARCHVNYFPDTLVLLVPVGVAINNFADCIHQNGFSGLNAVLANMFIQCIINILNRHSYLKWRQCRQFTAKYTGGNCINSSFYNQQCRFYNQVSVLVSTHILYFRCSTTDQFPKEQWPIKRKNAVRKK